MAVIVSDIATASGEQASGIDQVNKALAQMDEVTQQNSALVEENAATAKVLEQQARSMDEQVSFFHLDDGVHSGARMAPRSAAVPVVPAHRASVATKPASNSGSKSRPVRVQGAVALKEDPDWKEF